MAKNKRFILPAVLFFANIIPASAASASCPAGSAAAPGSRLSGDWHAAPAVSLAPGKTPVRPAGTDLGVASPATRLERILLLLQPSPAQHKSLDAFLQNQKTLGNCAYHQWLTPSEFADAFSNSPSDVAAVSEWLTEQGFSVAALPAGRGWIEFSGTAGEVEQAFGAPVHAFATASGTRYALTSAISVPSVFVPLIRGLASLDGALSTPALTTPQAVSSAPSELARATSPVQAEALTPELAAQLLHLDSVHASGTTGAGESIAIAARSNVQAADIAAFRSTFGLPATAVAVTFGGADPGLTADQAEAELAASWAGAAAPGARIVVVPAASTAATDGVDLALATIVDQALAHTAVVDFSSCEASLGDAHQAFYAVVYRQASAEGIAAIAATGDSGAAACYAAGGQAAVTTGYAVNGLASTPWNTAVGAVGFATSDGSVLAAWSPVSPADPAYAGGGGSSAAFGIPAWQPSIQPQGTGRMLPDLALPTAVDSAFSRGLAFCFSGTSTPSGCTLMRSGGTSAAAAIFGGITALAAQQDGPQGNLAPALYAANAQSGVFRDVQQGAATLPCAAGSPDCDASDLIGYAAGPGYDLATGLGSPNAQKLLAALLQPDATATISTPTVTSPANPSATIALSTTVTNGASTDYVDFCSNSLTTPLGSPVAVGSSAASVNVSTSITLTNNVLPASATPYQISAVLASDSTPTCTGIAVSPATASLSIQKSTTSLSSVTPSTYTPSPNITFTVSAVLDVTSLAVGQTGGANVDPSGAIGLTSSNPSATTITEARNVDTAGGITTTFNVTVTAPGPYTLTASYAGDNNYDSPSNTGSASVTASTLTANVGLTVSPTQQNNEYNPTTQLSFTATVTPQTAGGPTPAGTVTFVDQTNSQTLGGGPATLSGGTASVSNISGMPQNGNSIVAQYTPATGSPYGQNTSQVLTVNIQPSQTTTTVTPSTTTPAVGAAFSVTAAVAVTPNTIPPAGSASPQGTMTLTVDAGTTGVAPQTLPVTTTNGVTSANFTNVTVPTSGPHNLQASFASSNGNYQNSTSAPAAVNAGGTSVNFNWNNSVTAGTTYQANAPFVFNVTLTGANGGPTPTGTLAIIDTAGSTTFTVGSAPLVNGAASVTGTGLIPVGSNSVVAQYTPAAGSPYGTAPVNSTAIAFTVAVIPTTVTVTSSTQTPPVGSPFQVTVVWAPTITPLPGGAIPPTNPIPLTSSSPANTTITLASSQTNPTTGAITGVYNVTFSTSGTYTLSATFAGNSTFGPSTNSVQLTTGSSLVTVTLTATPTLAGPLQAITLTATVTPTQTPAAGAEANPTGSVTFMDGTTILGSAPLAAGPGDTAVAQLATSALPAGQDIITAVYSGDTSFTPATSNPVTVTVQDFSITPAPTNPPEDLDIIKGSAGQVAYTITGEGGFNNIISVVCNVLPQDDMSCEASPQLVTPTQTVTFTIGTYTSGGPTAQRNAPPLWPQAAGGTALAALLFFLLPSRRRARLVSRLGRRAMILLLLLIGLAGTGIGCTSLSGTAANQVNGTPLGLTTVTITAAAYVDNTVVSHSVYLLVDVLPQGSTGTVKRGTGGK